jgi:SAM-dependent methyltransferase
MAGYESRFDLLTAFELIEHLSDPLRFLRCVSRLLKPGGWFFMTTLNGQGFDIQVLWNRAKSVTPPHHLNFLNPTSLERLLSNSGLHVDEIDTPGKLDWDIVEGAIQHDGADPGRFWTLLSKKASPMAKREFQEWLSRNGLSSHMRAVARKSI